MSSSKEFDSIGLMKKDMTVDDMAKEADLIDVPIRLIAMIYSKMLKITERFLEIDNRLSTLEKSN